MARQPTPNVFDDLFRNPAVGAPVQVDLELIDDNPFQPRQTYDPATLEELANSIERNGYIEPTVDREAPDYIDAKLQRIVGWIDDYQDPGDGLPTPESVAGNFANLEKLLEVIAGQQSEADQIKLKMLYDHTYTRLAALSDRVTQSYAEE